LSGTIHDQKASSLCWAFATSSVIRAELKRLIILLFQNNKISASVKKEAIKLADQINKENRLLNELVCLVSPRCPKLEDFFGSNSGQSLK